MLWRGFGGRLGVVLGCLLSFNCGNFNGTPTVQREKMEIDVELGLKEVYYCECIGRDVGYGSHEELGMLWMGFGGRLGVDLGRFAAV